MCIACCLMFAFIIYRVIYSVIHTLPDSFAPKPSALMPHIHYTAIQCNCNNIRHKLPDSGIHDSLNRQKYIEVIATSVIMMWDLLQRLTANHRARPEHTLRLSSTHVLNQIFSVL